MCAPSRSVRPGKPRAFSCFCAMSMAAAASDSGSSDCRSAAWKSARRFSRAGVRGGRGPERLGVVFDTGDDAAHERGKQQQVDRREPRRQVDVEELEGVEDREQVGIVALPLCHAVGVGHPLREDRARNCGDGQHEEKHERRPHRGELTPPPAQPAHEPEPRLGDRLLAVDVVRGTQWVSHVVSADWRARRSSRRPPDRTGAVPGPMRRASTVARSCMSGLTRCEDTPRGARSTRRQ